MIRSLFLIVAAVAAVLPSAVLGHDCPAFNISDSATRAAILALNDTEFPTMLKDIISIYPDDNTTGIFTGVYDCHSKEMDHEVGVAAVCEPGDGDCTCVAQYNFQECRRCKLECYDNDDEMSPRKSITIKSFTADCSNVQGGLTEACSVGCGFVTSGCLASEPSGAVNATAPTAAPTEGVMVGPMMNTTETPPGGKDDDDDKDNGGDKNTTTVASPTVLPMTAPTVVTAPAPKAPTPKEAPAPTTSSATIPTAAPPTSGAAAAGTAAATKLALVVGATTAGLFWM